MSSNALAPNPPRLNPEYDFTPHAGLPRFCTSILNRVCDKYWEAKFGIRTAKGALSLHHDARHYGALAYYTYFKIFDRIGLKRGDVVVDVGCGKGRVVCMAATYPIKEAIGVEIDPGLCAAGRENGKKMRGAVAPMRFVCQSATDFNFYPVNTIVLVSPFGEETMEKMLDRVEESIETRPRALQVVYANPVLSPMLAARSWLKLFDCWNPPKWSRIKFPVHFYRSALALLTAFFKRITELTEAVQYCPI